MAKRITTPPPGDMLLKIRHIASTAIYRLVYLKNPTMTNGGPRNAWLAYNQSNSISHCVPEQDIFGFKPSFEIIDDRYNPEDRTEWDKIVSMRLKWRATFVAQLPTSNTYKIPGQAPTLPKSLANALRVGDTFLHRNGYTCAIAAMSSARVHYIDQIAASGNINGCCSSSAFVQRWKWLLPVKLPAPRLEVLSDPNY